MSERLLSYDRFTGIKTWWSWDALKGKNVLRYEYPDYQANVDYATALRNDTDYTKHGMKGDNALHYGNVPAGMVMEMMLKGIDTTDPKNIAKWLNEHPYLKYTDAHHE